MADAGSGVELEDVEKKHAETDTGVDPTLPMHDHVAAVGVGTACATCVNVGVVTLVAGNTLANTPAWLRGAAEGACRSTAAKLATALVPKVRHSIMMTRHLGKKGT